MLHETNSSNMVRGLFSNKEDLLCEMKSLMPTLNVKSEVMSEEERFKNIQEMVNFGFLLKVDDISELGSDIMDLGLTTASKTKRFKKTGIASTLPENSVMQPSKGKIYGRRFNGRFASKAIYKYHNLKSKITIQMEAAKKKYKLMKVRDSMVECGLKWTRMDKSRALKTLEALRTPRPIPTLGPKITRKKKTEELSDREPEPRYENPYEYDDCANCPPLPQAIDDFKCGMDFCRLGCVCQSIGGNRKKLLRKDHCCQHQCMFTCHCQHLTRSRATVFGNLSPIMDSKFSFTNLNKAALPTKKKLFTPKEDQATEDSGDEIRRKECEKKNSKPSKNVLDLSNGWVRKSGRLKDKSLYSSYVRLEDVVDKNAKKRQARRRKRSLKKNKSNQIPENSESPAKTSSPAKKAQDQECLEISSDTEDDSPPKKKKKVVDLPEKPKEGVFETPSMHPNGNFRMEHVLLKKKSEVDGLRQDLLVESYHDFDWKYCKKQVSSVFHENTFTKDGINKDFKCVEWRNFKIMLYPTKCKSSIPKHVMDRIENPSFEYVRTIITRLNKKEIVVINSPLKDSDSEDARSVICDGKQSNEIHASNKQTTIRSVKSPEKCDKSLDETLKNDEVIVVEDEVEELSDDSDCPGIINKVTSLAPSYNKIISPYKPPNIDPVITPKDTVSPNNPSDVTMTPVKPIDFSMAMTSCKPLDFSVTASTKPPSPLHLPKAPNYSPMKILPRRKCINSFKLAPFIQATGISGCRQFRFNAVTSNPVTIPVAMPTSQETSNEEIYSPKNSNSVNQSNADISSKYNLIKSINIQKDKEKVLSILNGQCNEQNVSPVIVKMPTSMTTASVGSPTPMITSPKLSVNPVSPNHNSLSPLNLSISKPPISPVTEAPKNIITPISLPSLKTSIGCDGKKIIVLKNTALPSRFLLPQFFQKPATPSSCDPPIISAPRILSQIPPTPNTPSPNSTKKPQLRNIVTLLPKNMPAVNSFRHLTPLVNQKSNVKVLCSKKGPPMPLILKGNTSKNSSSMETPDSEEEPKNLITGGMKDLKKIKLMSAGDNSPSSDSRSENIPQTNGDGQLAKEETSFDSKSGSSISDGNDDRHLYIKRLKLLYHEIAKIENIQEKHDKMSPGDILDMVLGAIKKLQDASVELANDLFTESEMRKKLVKKLQEMKGDERFLRDDVNKINLGC